MRDHVDHRRAEVEAHLLLEDRAASASARLLARGASSAGAAACASSPATTRMNTSSRLMPAGAGSRRGQPLRERRAGRSRRARRGRASDSTAERGRRRRATASGLDADHAGHRAQRRVDRVRGAAHLRSRRARWGRPARPARPRVPWATMRPRLMMMMPSHTIETSGRMCVERITVCCPPSERMSARISAICCGSRPMVGSSRISTSGSPRSAWARPDPLAIALGELADEAVPHVGDEAALHHLVDPGPARPRAARP